MTLNIVISFVRKWIGRAAPDKMGAWLKGQWVGGRTVLGYGTTVEYPMARHQHNEQNRQNYDEYFGNVEQW